MSYYLGVFINPIRTAKPIRFEPIRAVRFEFFYNRFGHEFQKSGTVITGSVHDLGFTIRGLIQTEPVKLNKHEPVLMFYIQSWF